MCMQENGALCQPQDLAWWKAWNWNWKKVQTCANMCLSEAVEQHKNTCLGTALEGEYASGGGPDRCAEELGTVAEGDAGGEAWQCECTLMCSNEAQHQAYQKCIVRLRNYCYCATVSRGNSLSFC